MRLIRKEVYILFTKTLNVIIISLMLILSHQLDKSINAMEFLLLDAIILSMFQGMNLYENEKRKVKGVHRFKFSLKPDFIYDCFLFVCLSRVSL